jgi:hypothetical protein
MGIKMNRLSKMLVAAPFLLIFSSSVAQQPETISVEKHTAVVAAAMDNADSLANELRLKERKKSGKPRPNGNEVLTAMLRLPGVDAGVKSTIKRALVINKQAKATRLPPPTAQALTRFQRELRRAKTTAEVESLLAREKSNPRSAQLKEGLAFAEKIIESGRSTIYSETYPFYSKVGGRPGSIAKEKKDSKTGEIVGADVGGAIGGCIATVATGCAGGAAAGAAGGSVAAVVTVLWNAIF